MTINLSQTEKILYKKWYNIFKYLNWGNNISSSINGCLCLLKSGTTQQTTSYQPSNLGVIYNLSKDTLYSSHVINPWSSYYTTALNLEFPSDFV